MTSNDWNCSAPQRCVAASLVSPFAGLAARRWRFATPRCGHCEAGCTASSKLTVFDPKKEETQRCRQGLKLLLDAHATSLKSRMFSSDEDGSFCSPEMVFFF